MKVGFVWKEVWAGGIGLLEGRRGERAACNTAQNVNRVPRVDIDGVSPPSDLGEDNEIRYCTLHSVNLCIYYQLLLLLLLLLLQLRLTISIVF